MEDVPVFMSRKLLPPPDVNIPNDIIANFKNDNRESLTTNYDFTLEKYVCTKISEWVRNNEIDKMNRDERIRLKDIERARKNEEKHKQLLTAVRYDDLSSDDDDEETNPDTESEKKISPNHTSFDTILQPTIVPNQVNSAIETSSSNKLLNYSDFETTESSPFDNVELKTINDLDILAQVLQSSGLQNRQQAEKEDIKTDNSEDIETKSKEIRPAISITNPPVFPPYFSPHHNGNNANVQNAHLIPDILKGLNNEILQSESRRSQSSNGGKF